MDLHGSEEEDISGCVTHYLLGNAFIAGSGLFMGFVDDKKNIDHHKTYLIIIGT